MLNRKTEAEGQGEETGPSSWGIRMSCDQGKEIQLPFYPREPLRQAHREHHSTYVRVRGQGKD